MVQWVYKFGVGEAEGSASMTSLLGGKGANLAEMANLGLPVPPGFTISTELCSTYYEEHKQIPTQLAEEVEQSLIFVESASDQRFGDPSNPLLLSVRSGSRASMPGMMDTVLNLGLNDTTASGLAAKTGDSRFAYDSYRRFIQMYSDVVLGVGHHEFEDILEQAKAERGISSDTEMTGEDWQDLINNYKALVKTRIGKPFPEDVTHQLWGAIQAVLDSWMNTRAVTYRKLYDLPESWGTAVNIQTMVFGNMGPHCATGVAFTRNPSTGCKKIYGEYLVNAQGEDVVAGIRTPQPLTSNEDSYLNTESADSLEEYMPNIFAELCDVSNRLETHYRDMQDIEFTVQEDKLWMLQTRSGKRTATAALQIAVDLVAEGILDQKTALRRIDPESLDQLLHPRLDPHATRDVITSGLPASPGAATGKIVFSSEKAEDRAAKGENVILVRPETSPEDIHGMHAAKAILTSRGGMTSHAAVVARGMGRPCITGALELRIDVEKGCFVANGITYSEDNFITVDGSTGEVLNGQIPTIEPDLTENFNTVMKWADKVRRLRIRANADTPTDAAVARKFGAEGIGLCRTEHMFFDTDRIISMREMILAKDKDGRRAALSKLLPMQREDFIELFKIMAGLPVTIRLLDPPLHEFLPHGEKEIENVASSLNLSFTEIKNRVSHLHENNPMLGHRGCRLGISFPEIYEMQVRAILEAAIHAKKLKENKAVELEIMIPLVATKKEVDILKSLIDKTASAVSKEHAMQVQYIVGTMIELPRAAIKAGEIAESAEFFSFGTNDLTQTALGISRDDAASFMDEYLINEVFPSDPFSTLDQGGVGELITLAVERGKLTRKALKLGICGEHGGDPKSIHFFHEAQLNYISCSPYRVPIARLAAAQAKLMED